MGVTERLNFDLSLALAAVRLALLLSRFIRECFILGLLSIAIDSASSRVSVLAARALETGAAISSMSSHPVI